MKNNRYKRTYVMQVICININCYDNRLFLVGTEIFFYRIKCRGPPDAGYYILDKTTCHPKLFICMYSIQC